MASQVIISRAIDPIFAIGVGAMAAAVRINREEQSKGRTAAEIPDTLKRRLNLAFGKEAPLAEKTAEKS